jgi:hypothetical protein
VYGSDLVVLFCRRLESLGLVRLVVVVLLLKVKILLQRTLLLRTLLLRDQGKLWRYESLQTVAPFIIVDFSVGRFVYQSFDSNDLCKLVETLCWLFIV